MKQIDSLVSMCIQKEYVASEDEQWLRYAIEKRIASLCAFVPLVIVGLLIADSATVLSFFITFWLLRTRTNGFHAKSISRCIIYSILGEVFFLKVLPMVWNRIIAFVSLVVSLILIWLFAPYNHRNIDLSSKEIDACAKSAKWRLSVLIFALSILHLCKQDQFVEGILLGIVMTASTLVMAYCSQKTISSKSV